MSNKFVNKGLEGLKVTPPGKRKKRVNVKMALDGSNPHQEIAKARDHLIASGLDPQFAFEKARYDWERKTRQERGLTAGFRFRGKVYHTGTFHDLTMLPDELQAELEGDAFDELESGFVDKAGNWIGQEEAKANAPYELHK